jgi:hypothetical protein
VESAVFKFGGVPVQTPSDLFQLCARHPKLAGIYLTGGDFDRWLSAIGRTDLAHVASESRRVSADGTEALHLFIEYCRMRDYLRRTPGRRLGVLLAGRTGVGKSSTINTLAGTQVADTDEYLPTTASVVSYDLEINGVPSRIVDTPGLADGKNLDDSYIDWIRRDVGEFGIDCLLFATPLHESRVRTDEIKAIETITNAFGSHIWRRSLALLTFADHFPEATQFKRKLAARPPGIVEAITKATSDPAAAEAIPFIPLTNKDILNPDGRRWLGKLQLALLDRMAPEGTSLFYGAGPDGGRNDARFRCYLKNGGGPPIYRFICRSAGTTGTCDFCRLSFEKTSSR